MSLKPQFANATEIPENIRNLYVERDGAWQLDVDGGMVPKAKLEEFRTNNHALENRLRAFEGIDPAAVRQALADKARLEEEAAKKSGDFDKLLNSRLTPLQEQLKALQGERDAAQGRLADLTITQAAVQSATKRGLAATAIPDLSMRVKQAFRLDAATGAPVAYEADGKTVRAGKSGQPMTLDEWCEELAAQAPHLFASNSGGGASGAIGAGGGAAEDNPWSAKGFNLTRQGEILRKDPARAKVLMSQAGK